MSELCGRPLSLLEELDQREHPTKENIKEELGSSGREDYKGVSRLEISEESRKVFKSSRISEHRGR